MKQTNTLSSTHSYGSGNIKVDPIRHCPRLLEDREGGARLETDPNLYNEEKELLERLHTHQCDSNTKADIKRNYTTYSLHVSRQQFNWVTSLQDSGNAGNATYLNFSKPFHKVPHEILISVLVKYGLDEIIIRWINNWLDDQTQSVLIGGFASIWRTDSSAAPQGSVSSLVLFHVFINYCTWMKGQKGALSNELPLGIKMNKNLYHNNITKKTYRTTYCILYQKKKWGKYSIQPQVQQVRSE